MFELINSPARLSRFVLVLSALLMAVTVSAQTSDSDAEQAAVAPEPEATPTIAEMFAEREALQAFLQPLQDPGSAEYLASRRAELQDLRDELSNMQKVVSDDALGSLSFEDLVDLQTDVRAELKSLELVAGQVRTRAEQRDKQLDELDARRANWAQLTEVARQRDAPQSVLAVAAETAANLEQTRAALLADRNAALEDLSAVAGLQQAAAAFNSELKSRRDELEVVSQLAADAPLWSKSVWTAPSGFDEAAPAVSRYWTTIVSHIASNYVILGAIFVGLWIAARLLLLRTGARVADAMRADATSMRAATVFNKPRSAAFLTALLGLAWFGPPAPAAFNYMLWALMPLPAAWLAVSVFAKPIRLSIYTIALVVALMSLKPFIDAMPLVSRFVLLLQSVLVITALLIDYKRGNWQAAFPSVNPSVIRWSVHAVCAALLVVIVLEVTGLVGLSNTLRSMVLGGLGFAMIFTSITYVLTGLLIALVYIKPFSALPFVKNQRWTVIRTARKTIRYIMALVWLLVTMNYAGQLVPAITWLSKYLGAEFEVGAVTLHVSSLVAGLLILYATFLLKRLVGFVFASKSLSGVNVAEGVAFAVSKVLGYVIIVAGFLFAISAMGFDITKVTVLAGAVGVGIGLGLQSIVNNFLSGLILLFEQPIKINDVAKVDDLMGTVRELGVRATVIETFDGAEVIVPNSDFISKTVTNWTKSNRRRRAEIEVGVAYGTDPQKVLDILDRSARAHKEVMDDPEPFAVFVGFGDSSLNFRLYVWLTDLSEVIRTPGHIRQQILNELNAAGIEIPFPQRDVRVTMSPAAATGGVAAEAGGMVDKPTPAQ